MATGRPAADLLVEGILPVVVAILRPAADLPAVVAILRPAAVAILRLAADLLVGDLPVVDLPVAAVMDHPVADLLLADLLVGDHPVVNRQGLRSSVASCLLRTTGRSSWARVARRSIRWLRLPTAGTR